MSDDANAKTLELNRRDLLKASVVSGAALAFMSPSNQAEAEPCGKIEWPPLGKDPEGLEVKALSCDNEGSAALPSPEEQVESALDFMWCEFQKAVFKVGKDSDIDFNAIVLARRRLRSRVQSYITDTNNGASPGEALIKFASTGYGSQFKTNWEATADAAAKAAGAGTIDTAIMSSAWKGPTDESQSPLDIAEEGTEQAGAHMWFHFTWGVLKADATGCSLDVIAMGRLYSRYYVRLNIIKTCVVRNDTTGKYELDMSKWQWDGLEKCTSRAGFDAGLRAGKGNPIDPGDFDDAWCHESKVQKRLIKMKCAGGKELGIFTSGC